MGSLNMLIQNLGPQVWDQQRQEFAAVKNTKNRGTATWYIAYNRGKIAVEIGGGPMFFSEKSFST